MGKINAVNLDITNNPDGFDISGGSTSRKLTVTGADITLSGSGTATITFPTTSTTLAGLGIAQTFTATQSLSGGLSANSLWVGGQGATFNSNSTFNSPVAVLGGLTANSLWVGGQGATFNSTVNFNNLTTFAAGLTALTLTAQTGTIHQFSTTQITGTSANITTLRATNINTRIAGGTLTINGSGGNVAISETTGLVSIATDNAVQFYDATTGLNQINIRPSVSVADFGSYTLSGTSARFAVGLSASGLWVGGNGATFNSRATVLGGLSANSLWVGGNGATFNSNSTFTNRASFNGGLTTSDLQVSKGATFTDIVNSATLRNYGEVFAYQVRKELNDAKTVTHYGIDLRYGNTFYLSLVGTDNAGTFGGYPSAAAKPSIQVPFDANCLLATTAGVTGATATTLTGSLTAGQLIFSPGLTDTGCTAFNIHGSSTVVLSKPASFTTNAYAVFINQPSEGLGMGNSPAGTASKKSPARVHTFTMIVDCTAGSSITWNSGLTSYGQIKWPSGTAPTITTTGGKLDVFSFLSYDYGVSWLGFNAGQNF